MLIISVFLYFRMLLFIPIDQAALVDLLFPSTRDAYLEAVSQLRAQPMPVFLSQIITDMFFALTFYPSLAFLVRARSTGTLFLISGAADVTENVFSLLAFFSGSAFAPAPCVTNVKFISLALAVLFSLFIFLWNLSKRR